VPWKGMELKMNNMKYESAKQIPEELREFTVCRSKKTIILTWSIIAVLAVLMVGFNLSAAVFGNMPENAYTSSIISTVIFISLIAFFTRFLLKRWKIYVSGDTLYITPQFKKAKTVSFSEIAKAEIYPDNSYPNFVSLKLFSNQEMICKVYKSFDGSKELAERLKIENVPTNFSK
jgi:hypothetical protein